MLLFAPSSERILLVGVSRSRPLRKLVTLGGDYEGVDFVPVSRADPGNQLRRVPHSIRVAFGAAPVLFRTPLRGAVLQVHRLEAGLIARLKRAHAHVFFVHTNTAASLRASSDSFWRRAPLIFRFLETRLMKGVDLTIVFNRASADEYAARGLRVQYMTTWFNHLLFKPPTNPTSPADTRTVTWAGRFELPKDPVLAIEVFAKLATLDMEGEGSWRFLMIGDGTLKEDVIARARELGVLERIEFTGAISRHEVAEALRHSSVLLMTSHFEGSPRVMYESMACGTPVVATAEADADNVLAEGRVGLALATREPSSLAEGIRSAAFFDRVSVADAVAHQASDSAVQRLWRITSNHTLRTAVEEPTG